MPLAEVGFVSRPPESGGLGTQVQRGQAFPLGPTRSGVLIFLSDPKDPVTQRPGPSGICYPFILIVPLRLDFFPPQGQNRTCIKSPMAGDYNRY